MISEKAWENYECSGQISMFEGLREEGTCGSCMFHRTTCCNAASTMYAQVTEPEERCGKWQRAR